MEHRHCTRNVALIEKCVMSGIGIQNLFNATPDNQYNLHLYLTLDDFQQAMKTTVFSAVIFSLSSIRKYRRVGLMSLTGLAENYPGMRRLVIADDDVEARLISVLSPFPLDGVLSKEAPLPALQEALFTALSGARRINESNSNLWYLNQSRMLSPTEREILRFMSCGYSMPQIATELARNIKTIRAHKFNVMSKLGVSSDAGLLHAADILL
ncbi:TPA: DNA-binding transcriptional activator BglJ [Citrobacter amalonaticus]|uniref:DNA-binding transcriptional activator BglJ n=1 Tax=Citrobacter amalonaticus TaxID=35703 RepID=A0A9C7QJ90_CITAM|nr:DNA-binding transcriptional activator BglJ [Citrobacter amalonaticus]